jgi:L-lysine 6-transaminase
VADSVSTVLPPHSSAAPTTRSALDLLRLHVAGDFADIVVDLDASSGCQLVDQTTGTSYLDMTTYFSSAPLGHNHPALSDPAFAGELLRAARAKPSNPDFPTMAQAEFTRVFLRVLGDPELPLLFFIDGGALAVENALKIAFDWKTKRNAEHGLAVRGSRVLHFEHAFHGRSGYTLSLTNTDPAKTRDYPVFDWPRLPAPAVHDPDLHARPGLLPEEHAALDTARAAIRRHGAEIACCVFEPIQGEGGDRHFRPRFLSALQRLCQEHDILTVVDEVQTGCGTAGSAWAYQALGLEPDLVAFGKKTQVCGVMGGRRVLAVRENAFRESSRISSTWGGSLVDMVRAQRMLETIEREDLFGNSARQGRHLLQELRALVGDFPRLLGEPRGRGLMCAVNVVDTASRDLLLTVARTRQRALFLPCGATGIRFRPPLSVQQDDLDAAVTALREAAAEVEKGLCRELPPLRPEQTG